MNKTEYIAAAELLNEALIMRDFRDLAFDIHSQLVQCGALGYVSLQKPQVPELPMIQAWLSTAANDLAESLLEIFDTDDLYNEFNRLRPAFGAADELICREIEKYLDGLMDGDLNGVLSALSRIEDKIETRAALSHEFRLMMQVAVEHKYRILEYFQEDLLGELEVWAISDGDSGEEC